jgi:hypothetical protein
MKYMHDIVLEHSSAMLKVNEIIIIFCLANYLS